MLRVRERGGCIAPIETVRRYAHGERAGAAGLSELDAALHRRTHYTSPVSSYYSVATILGEGVGGVFR
jgi:hypothetical protein